MDIHGQLATCIYSIEKLVNIVNLELIVVMVIGMDFVIRISVRVPYI